MTRSLTVKLRFKTFIAWPDTLTWGFETLSGQRILHWLGGFKLFLDNQFSWLSCSLRDIKPGLPVFVIILFRINYQSLICLKNFSISDHNISINNLVDPLSAPVLKDLINLPIRIAQQKISAFFSLGLKIN